MRTSSLLGPVLLLTVAATVAATPVSVTVTGTVEYNQVTIGEFAGVSPGDPVTLSFMVDSDNFLDSGSFPTRGYVINEPSFLLTMGPASALLHNPFPGTPYFVIRNNDPAVDGFFLSTGTDFPVGLQLDEPANLSGTRFFTSYFNVSYDGALLGSLDILDAIGTYGFGGLMVFGFWIDDLGFEPIGFIFESLTIAGPVSVESSSWGSIKNLYR
jgi:hypothetical protein